MRSEEMEVMSCTPVTGPDGYVKVGNWASEGVDGVALIHQLGDAGQAGGAGYAVVGNQVEAVLLGVFTCAEHVGATAGDTGHGVGHCLVQSVHRVCLVADHAGPARAGALEVDRDVGAALLE